MGMFDTIDLSPPLICPLCGHAESALQTHHFGEMLHTYRVGMLLRCCPVISGILEETFWCSACHNAGEVDRPKLYVVIWHSILAGTAWTKEAAEAKLASLDRLDLLDWLDLAQREAAAWRRKYHKLRDDLARWQEYQQNRQEPPAEEGKPRLAYRQLFAPDEQIRAAEDPLLAILERHPPDAPADPFG